MLTSAEPPVLIHPAPTRARALTAREKVAASRTGGRDQGASAGPEWAAHASCRARPSAMTMPRTMATAGMCQRILHDAREHVDLARGRPAAPLEDAQFAM